MQKKKMQKEKDKKEKTFCILPVVDEECSDVMRMDFSSDGLLL